MNKFFEEHITQDEIGFDVNRGLVAIQIDHMTAAVITMEQFIQLPPKLKELTNE